MEQRRNSLGRHGATGLLPAFLLGLAMLLTAAHGLLQSGGQYRIAAFASAAGGLGVADQAAAPVISKRSLAASSFRGTEPSALAGAGDGHAFLAADTAERARLYARQTCNMRAQVLSAENTDRGYDACAPPARA